jgi:hypothetical protein
MTYKSGPSSNDRPIPKEVPLLPNCRTIPSKFNPTTFTGSLMASRIEQTRSRNKQIKGNHSKSQKKI